MNLLRVAEHTVDLDLLPEAPIVLDVGCRWFDFAGEILKLRPAARVLALDPDPEIKAPELERCTFVPVALVGDGEKSMVYESYYTGIGNFLHELGSPYLHQLAAAYTAKGQGKRLNVPCTNVAALMEAFGVTHWDLVKLDCEAAEFHILERWPGPIATQLSVEFHDYVHRGKWDANYFEWLFGGRLRDYRVVQHEDHMLGGGMGHWDSLLVLNEERRPGG